MGCTFKTLVPLNLFQEKIEQTNKRKKLLKCLDRFAVRKKRPSLMLSRHLQKRKDKRLLCSHPNMSMSRSLNTRRCLAAAAFFQNASLESSEDECQQQMQPFRHKPAMCCSETCPPVKHLTPSFMVKICSIYIFQCCILSTTSDSEVRGVSGMMICNNPQRTGQQEKREI